MTAKYLWLIVCFCLLAFSEVYAFDIHPAAVVTSSSTTVHPSPTPSPTTTPPPNPGDWKDGSVKIVMPGCFYFQASKITFSVDGDPPISTLKLYEMYGVPDACVNYKECLGIPNPRARHLHLNYTKKGTADVVFMFQMNFTHDGSGNWRLAEIMYCNTTHINNSVQFVYLKSLVQNNDMYGYSEQSYQCDHISFRDDYMSSSIAFDSIKVQPFDIEGDGPSSNMRHCQAPNSDATTIVAIAVGCVVGSCVLFAAITLGIILVYRRCRYNDYSLLES